MSNSQKHQIKITLFFTYGVSLKSWADTGLLQREIRLYQELIRRYGFQISFLTYGNSSDRKWENELDGIQLLPVYERILPRSTKLLRFFQTLLIPWKFRKELRQTDLLKTNQIRGGWIAVISKWLFKKPLIVRGGYDYYYFTKKGNKSDLYKLIVKFLSTIIYRAADQINLATSEDKKFVINTFKIPEKSIEVHPNWINTDKFTYRSQESRVFKVLHVGRLSVQKNIPILFEAFAGTGIEIDFIGSGKLENILREKAQGLGVKANFLGNFPNDDMPKFYQSYAVYVLCSTYEGNPKTLLEAMACGCSVVGTNVPGIRNIIKHNKTGLLIPSDPKKLKEAILNLFNNDLLRERLGKAAREKVIIENSLEIMLNKENMIYKRLAMI